MNLISVVLSYAIALWFTPKWVTVGLAGIFTIHYFIGTAISFYLIKRHQVRLPITSIILYYLKLIAVFGLIITPFWLIRNQIPGGNLISLILVITVPGVLYLLIARLLKITEVTDLLKVFTGRKD